MHEALGRTAQPAAANAGHGQIASVPADLAGDGNLDRDEYIAGVEALKEAIVSGEVVQTVLARRQTFDGSSLNGLDLYRSLRRVSPSPYLFFVRMPDFEVVGASPELLLQVEGDKITTHPIAGTRPRGLIARYSGLR